jgi:uncharacterized protein
MYIIGHSQTQNANLCYEPMMNSVLSLVSTISAWALIAYLAYESAISLRDYRRLKQAIAAGDSQARPRYYREILLFEGVSAVLAVAALRFDFSRFNPARLQIGGTAFGKWWAMAWTHVDAGFLWGAGIGLSLAIAVVIVALRRVRLRTASSLPTTSPWHKILPDFSALVPVTPRERVLFALVALAAGICEEVVYRAWLLDALHGAVGLNGATLVVVAALLFGFGHYYQGPAGILITSVLGFAFCGLYIASGSLLVPIAIHALIDLRVAIFPTISAASEKTS